MEYRLQSAILETRTKVPIPVTRRNDLYRLLKHLNLTRVTLLGCSMSGEIILDFTLEHPEMVSALGGRFHSITLSRTFCTI